MTFNNGKWHEIWSAICKNFYSKAQVNSKILKFEDLTGTTGSTTYEGWYWVDVVPSVSIDRVKTVTVYTAGYPTFTNVIPATSKIRAYGTQSGKSITLRVGYI